MMRSEARRARNAGEPPRTLWEADYLLLVDDETRQGAPRFAAQEGGLFLREAADHRTPPLIELPALLAASEHAYDEVETEEDLRASTPLSPRIKLRDKRGLKTSPPNPTKHTAGSSRSGRVIRYTFSNT